MKYTHHKLSLHFTRCMVLTPLPHNFATSRMEYPLRNYPEKVSLLRFFDVLATWRELRLRNWWVGHIRGADVWISKEQQV